MTPRCPQCVGITKAGERCRRTTCRYAPHCSSHRAYRVSPSRIPNAGRGAFKACDLKKGGTIGSYVIATAKQTKGKFMTEHPSGRATHTAKVGNHYYTALGAGIRTHDAI